MSEERTTGATAGAPSPVSENLNEGWYGPPNSRRFHYFREGRSLCGKWMVFVSDVPWDCAACKRALDTADCQQSAPKEPSVTRPAPKPERKEADG